HAFALRWREDVAELGSESMLDCEWCTGAVGARQLGRDHTPRTLEGIARRLLGETAQVERACEVQGIAAVRPERLVARGLDLVDLAVAVVIDPIADDLVGARVDQGGVRAPASIDVAAVSTTDAPAIAVLVAVVDRAIAVVVDTAIARLRRRE